MFSPNLLKALNALLTERSVTRAARQLNISQSTMSGILARLREQFDDPLLVRDGAGMELTYRAIEIAPLAKQAALAIEDLTARLDAPSLQDDRRIFTIMASDYGVQLILLDALRKALEQAPLVRFLVLPITSSVESISDGIADLCLTGDTVAAVGPVPAGVVLTRVILRESYVCAVDRHFESNGEIAFDEYDRHRRATISFDRSALTLEDRVVLARPAAPAQIVLPSFHAIGELVQRAQAIALVPAQIGQLLQRIYDIDLLRPTFECAETDLRMLWHLRKDQDPFHRWFRNLVQETASELKPVSAIAPSI